MEESPIGMTDEISWESQRRDPRDSLFMLARLRPDSPAAEAETVRVRNVSSGGLMAQASVGYRVGDAVEVELDGIGRVKGSVAWAEAGRIGIAFDHPIDKARARKPVAAKTKAAEAPPRPLADFKRPPIRTR